MDKTITWCINSSEAPLSILAVLQIICLSVLHPSIYLAVYHLTVAENKDIYLILRWSELHFLWTETKTWMGPL